MINTYVRGRATGKTTEIIIRLKENENLIALVGNREIKKLYPTEIHDRVFVLGGRNLSNLTELKGVKFDKVLIDEGFLMDKANLAQFYYDIGRMGIDVDVYGTIDDENPTEFIPRSPYATREYRDEVVSNTRRWMNRG